MTFLDTQMKELGRTIQINTHNTRLIIYTLQVCPRHSCRWMKPLRRKSVSTHRNKHAHSRTRTCAANRIIHLAKGIKSYRIEVVISSLSQRQLNFLLYGQSGELIWVSRQNNCNYLQL